MGFTSRDISGSGQVETGGTNWKNLAQSAIAGLGASGTESGNDAGSIAMNIASSTGEGALAGTAISPGWGSLIGAIAGLGKGIITSAIGSHKASQAEEEANRLNREQAETKRMINTGNRMSTLQANDEAMRQANDRYANLDNQVFTRNFTLGFTRALRG